MPTNIRDPRSIITPDAFEIRPELLGTPLAGAWRRFWAMMIDLATIGMLTALLDSIQLLVWAVVGLFFLRIALQRQGRNAATMAVLLRGFAGCLGGVILLVVSIIGVFVYLDGNDGPERGDLRGRAGGVVVDHVTTRIIGAALSAAEDPDEVVELTEDLLESFGGTGPLAEEPLAVLRRLTPADAPWAGQADSLYREAIVRWETGRDVAGDEGESEVEPDVDAPRIQEEVGALTDAQAVQALLQHLEIPDTVERSPTQAAREEAVRLRVLERLAGDTLRALEERMEGLARVGEDAREDVEELRRELEEEQSGFANLLRDIWEQLGSAIGIWSIYFTVLLTLWQGRTPGKRLVGVRVLRLDGEPITWWSAFERAGGYIAGLATGLLGFAQIFWDPNRQCIHDKIVGTVVVREHAAPIPGAWQEAASHEPTREVR